MSHVDLDALRVRVDEINVEILRLINERTGVVQEIGKVKEKQGVNRYDPLRERQMLDLLKENNDGPLPQSTVEHIFKEIFKSALELQEDDQQKALLVSRKRKAEDTIVDINGEKIGTGTPTFIFGPCAVESYDASSRGSSSYPVKRLKTNKRWGI